MPPDHLERLLDRLPDSSAERAARWLLWSVIARRLALSALPVVAVVLHGVN